MVHVGEQEALYELDTRLIFLNNVLMSIMQAISYLRYTVAVLTDVHTVVTHLTSDILSLKKM